MPAACTIAVVARVPPDQKSANDSPARAASGRMPLPPRRRSPSCTSGSSCARRFEEVLDRLAVRLVVVFPHPEIGPWGRSAPRPGRAHQSGRRGCGPWGAEGDTRAHCSRSSARRRELRVFAAARVNRECPPPSSRRHLVGVQPRGVHDDRWRRSSPAVSASAMPCGDRDSADQWRAAQTASPRHRRKRREAAHERFGFHDAARRRPEGDATRARAARVPARTPHRRSRVQARRWRRPGA